MKSTNFLQFEKFVNGFAWGNHNYNEIYGCNNKNNKQRKKKGRVFT